VISQIFFCTTRNKW